MSSESDGRGDDPEGVEGDRAHFPSPGVLGFRPERWEALCEMSETVVGDIPLELGGVVIPHIEEGLHISSFVPEEFISSF